MKEYAVIFDLDGTLWDISDTATFTANTVAAKHGLPEISKATVKKAFGQRREGSAVLYFPHLPLKDSLPLIDEIISQTAKDVLSKGGKLYADLIDTLKVLNGDYDLYIISNSPQAEYVKSFIDFSGTADLFKGFYSVGELRLTKGESIAKVVSDNNYTQAVYVGDTELDFAAANEGGVTFVFAGYGFGEVKGAKYRIDSICELPQILMGVFGQ
ncbi:MAG: HAD family hydrolase [Clostridia bacterium]|nr:HAD family hydrolase [Clostridia bacterium]